MRYGTLVLVKRGSPNIKFGPGRLRKVKGVLIGNKGSRRDVRLLQNDPDATIGYCTKKGDVGWWSASCVSRA